MDNKERLCKVYKDLDSIKRERINQIKDLGAMMLDVYDSIGQYGAIETAKTRLEESVMWAVKHVARDWPDKKT